MLDRRCNVPVAYVRNAVAEAGSLRSGDLLRGHEKLDLHRALIDFDAIEVLGSLDGTLVPYKHDRGDATALAVRSVRQDDLLDWANGGVEVVLIEFVPC